VYVPATENRVRKQRARHVPDAHITEHHVVRAVEKDAIRRGGASFDRAVVHPDVDQRPWSVGCKGDDRTRARELQDRARLALQMQVARPHFDTGGEPVNTAGKLHGAVPARGVDDRRGDGGGIVGYPVTARPKAAHVGGT